MQGGEGPRTHPEKRASKRDPQEEGPRDGKKSWEEGTVEAEAGRQGCLEIKWGKI